MFTKLFKPQAVLAEFLGTTILAMVYLVLTQTTGVSYFIGTSVAVTLGVVYLIFSQVSGGHFNPAITLGMWTMRKINTISGVLYIVAQVLGGLTAWGVYSYLTSFHIAPHAATWHWTLFWAEAIGTLVLALGYGAAVSKGKTAVESALSYGFALFVGIMIAATASAAYLNPAVALGSMRFHWDWVYILGPLVGGLVGINLFGYLFGGAKLPSMATSPAKKK